MQDSQGALLQNQKMTIDYLNSIKLHFHEYRNMVKQTLVAMELIPLCFSTERKDVELQLDQILKEPGANFAQREQNDHNCYGILERMISHHQKNILDKEEEIDRIVEEAIQSHGTEMKSPSSSNGSATRTPQRNPRAVSKMTMDHHPNFGTPQRNPRDVSMMTMDHHPDFRTPQRNPRDVSMMTMDHHPDFGTPERNPREHTDLVFGTNTTPKGLFKEQFTSMITEFKKESNTVPEITPSSSKVIKTYVNPSATQLLLSSPINPNPGGVNYGGNSDAQMWISNQQSSPSPKSPTKYKSDCWDTEVRYVLDCITKTVGILSGVELKNFLDEVKDRKKVESVKNCILKYTDQFSLLRNQLHELNNNIKRKRTEIKISRNYKPEDLDNRLSIRINILLQKLGEIIFQQFRVDCS